MNATLDVNSLLEDALLLPVEERSRMASRLIESLDEDVEISPAWQEEINRRVESARNGTTRSIPHEEVMSEVRQLLADIRQRKQSS